VLTRSSPSNKKAPTFRPQDYRLSTTCPYLSTFSILYSETVLGVGLFLEALFFGKPFFQISQLFWPQLWSFSLSGGSHFGHQSTGTLFTVFESLQYISDPKRTMLVLQ
jgi:hypothetical protein